MLDLVTEAVLMTTGIDFTRPLIDWGNSELRGVENLVKIKDQLAKVRSLAFLFLLTVDKWFACRWVVCRRRTEPWLGLHHPRVYM